MAISAAIKTDLPEGLAARLHAVVGPAGWVTDPDALAPHLTEQRGLYVGRTPVMLKPASTSEVSQILTLCNDAGQAIVPQGGNTGLVGGGVPHGDGCEIILNLSRLDRIRELDAHNFTLTAEAGCILADIQRAADDADRYFPLSLGAEGSCEIGGNLSTNAGGTNVVRYGNARDLALGLEVVLADGTVWNGLNKLRKDNTGYDLKHLFIGAEGTLGVITAAVLKLYPKPREMVTAFVAVRDLPGVIELLARMRSASGDAVSTFEYLSRVGIDIAMKYVPATIDPLERSYEHCVLVELSSAADGGGVQRLAESLLAAAIDDGLILDGTIAQSDTQARALWHLRDAVPEGQKMDGGSIKHDVSVPVSRVADFIATATAACLAEMPGCRPIPFGHVGDGNIHFNVNQPEGMDKAGFLAQWARFNRIVHDIVRDMDGSISAEHGIGQLKRAELRHYAVPEKLDLMAKVKGLLDPNNILNPDKVL
ncbi:MAG: FAD-binding oxidoreductase [Alphaproteobacteria bacterium]|nr:FAD-binding oxidoreductase [Alphaproteobacteria bacterium]